jgi:beta-glucosidase-like glycosyl hydrolase
MPRPPARLHLAVVLCALACAVLPGCARGLQEGRADASTTSRSPSATASATTSPEATGSATSSAPSSSAPPATGPEARAEAVLAGLDRRQQVLQLFVVGVPLADLGAGAPLAAEGVGGIFLAGRSTAPASALAATTDQWQSAAPGIGLWVACDQEGGAVQALKGEGFTRLPSAVEQGQLPHEQLAALTDGMGASLAAAGVNLDLAPVADIVPAGTEASNAPIGAFGRQYGSSAAQVVPAAQTVLGGLAAHGVTGTLKHFPGLGRVRENTDTTASVVDSVTTVGDEQVTAFVTLARSAARPFVMSSSATYARIDPTRPAAFSPVLLTQVLRDQYGVDGVIISDDLGNADAVAFEPPGQRAVRFIGAGGTLVLTVDPALLPAMVDGVLQRDRKDTSFRADVDRAVRTALVAKARTGLLD